MAAMATASLTSSGDLKGWKNCRTAVVFGLNNSCTLAATATASTISSGGLKARRQRHTAVVLASTKAVNQR